MADKKSGHRDRLCCMLEIHLIRLSSLASILVLIFISLYTSYTNCRATDVQPPVVSM